MTSTGSHRTHPLPTEVPGVALLPASFERLIGRLRESLDALVEDEGYVQIGAPPVISRETVERAGYVAAFPNLLGSVHHFGGTGAEWHSLRLLARPGGQWHTAQRLTDVVLTPAACYHVYPLLAGTTLSDAALYGVESSCYRHESTDETGRLRSFRMKELVRVGAAADCAAWRDSWCERTVAWLADQGVKVELTPAVDAFFGPGAALMRQSQLEGNAKTEFVAPVGDGQSQAVASVNLHQGHFGSAFDIVGPDGEAAYSACMAFGLERIALAVLHAQGGRA